MKVIIFTISTLFFFTGCLGGDTSKQEWTSLIYPDKQNTKRSKQHGVYKTIEECRTESLKELDNLGLKAKGTYQCGLNCEYHEGMKLDICERLEK